MVEKLPLLDDRRGKRAALVVLPLTVLMFFGMAMMHFNYTPDDTYIYLQFAKNFLHGYGLSFNVGEPTYGFTSPLWLCIVSLGGLFGGDGYVASKAVDLLCACLTIVVVYLLAAEIVRDHVVALLSALASSLNVWQVRWAGTGMETSLAALLVVTTLLFCLRNQYIFASLLASLLTLVRPEACLLFILILGDLYLNAHDGRHTLRIASAMVCTFVLVLLPWLLYAYQTFGTIIPNTFHAKSSVGLTIGEMGREFFDIAAIIAASDGLSFVVLLGSIVFLIRRLSSVVDGRIPEEEKFFLFRQSFAGLLWIAVVLIVYCALRVPVVSRYFVLITPVITVFAVTYFFQAVNRSRIARHPYVAVVVLTGFLILQNQTVYHLVVRPGVDAFAHGMETTLIPIGSWLKENAPADDVVMAWDIGAVGYFSDRPICDAAGLVTPAMMSLTRQGFTYNQIIEQRLYKSHCNVRYIVHRSEQPAEFKNDRGLAPVLTRPFYKIGLVKNDMVYYTLYKVINDSLK